MAYTKVSALTAKTTPAGTEELLINDGGVSKKITQTNLLSTALPLAGGTMTGDVSLGDNVKAKFGAGDDLQIYHTGLASFIEDVGPGGIVIKTNNISILSDTNESIAQFTSNGAVTLYHDNLSKLATTSTGIDVTGSVTCDGSSNIASTFNSGSSNLVASFTSTDTEAEIQLIDTTGSAVIKSRNDFRFFVNGGSTRAMDISSTGNVGIGTTTPAAKLDVNGTLACDGFTSTGIDDNATSTAITIDASENVALVGDALLGSLTGFSGGTGALTIADSASNPTISIRGPDAGTANIYFGDTTDWTQGAISYDFSTDAMRFYTSNINERMRIDSSGNVNVKTGNLVIGTSGKGIDFSAVSDGSRSVSSNLLDDYEEGTWTPTWSDGTNADATYTIRNGFYTKIGNKVSVYCDIAITSLGTISGILRLTGLPFPTGNQASCTVGFTSSLNTTAGHSITGRTSSGNTYILMNIWDTAAGLTGLLDTELSSNGRLMVSMEYFA